MHKNIIHNWAFRILTPLIFGFFVYVLVLMFFGSVDQLFQHFLSVEYLICVLLCYINFGIWRVAIKFCERKFVSNPWKQIVIETLVSLLLGVVVTWALVWLYFKYLVGFINFSSELIIFCSLMAATAIVYNMVYTSQFLLNYKHKEVVKEQTLLKKEATERWHRFQNRINPNLLYVSLERLIGLAYHDKEKADDFLMDLTQLYRKVLDSRDELIPIDMELEIVEKFQKLVHQVYDEKVEIILLNSAKSANYILPGFVVLKLEQIISNNIISAIQPLKITIEVNEFELVLKYRQNKKLGTPEQIVNLNIEEEILNWYTQKQIVAKKTSNNSITITIPLINLDNENSNN